MSFKLPFTFIFLFISINAEIIIILELVFLYRLGFGQRKVLRAKFDWIKIFPAFLGLSQHMRTRVD